ASTNSRTAPTTGWSMGERILQYGSMPLDDLVLGMQRTFDRLVRRLRLGPPPAPGRRRLLIVQIDGLSRAVLAEAIARGRAPFLARLLRRRGYLMAPMCVGLPTSTPAFQLAAMYGVRPDIPGFNYYDKRRKTDVYFPRGGDAAHVEHTQAAGRRGIVDGGGTYGCVFTGGAASNLLTFAMIKRPTGAGLIRAAAKLVVIGWVLVKGSIASTVEVVRALLRMVADPLSAASGNWKWLAIKLGISVWLRELFTLAVAHDIYAGVPTIYVNYLDYDVAGHAWVPPAVRELSRAGFPVGARRHARSSPACRHPRHCRWAERVRLLSRDAGAAHARVDRGALSRAGEADLGLARHRHRSGALRVGPALLLAGRTVWSRRT